ncbi:FMN-binding protein [Alicyclobacillus sp. ALC3]|uniref:FMN-binding protein n=1 Tax=Alicyclobacillus sp. ALC3 TaxID=2796143 RepID=UPI0023784A84|nr:FMN-binding protein [Alicyclobacillus sp. ALC3]WDL96138.1 FMN-binding protein [Alicyclobacillus sp. ALC3]
MAGRMSNRFVALASAAVGAVYVAGYVLTNSGNTALASSQAVPISGPSATQSPSSSSQHSGGGGTSSTNGGGSNKSTTPSGGSSNKSTSKKGSTGSSTTSTSSASQHKYLDGTYNGTGTNPIGSVSVALKIKGGKITNVQITQCLTHYPEAYIDPVLPQEVVQRQSYQVTIVTGATLSTYDFAYAVYQALNKAKNPHYKA